MKSHEEIQMKCLHRFAKMAPIFLYRKENIKDGTYTRVDYYIFYKEKGIAKYSMVSDPYLLRYGPRPLANLKGEGIGDLWQSRGGIVDSYIYKFLRELYLYDEIEQLDVLDYSNFKFEE